MGTDLYVHYPQVGDEIPPRHSVTVVAIKAKASCVVDSISCLGKTQDMMSS